MSSTAPAQVHQTVVASPSTARLPPVGRRRRRALVVGLIAAAVLVALLAGWLAGLRVFVVESPSMGPAAPVGTLVVGVPAGARVHVGDVITYTAPGGSGTYTHRVVQQQAGGLVTRGDINGAPDPWPVTPSMIVSRALVLLPGVGWLVRAAPILIGGGMSAWVLAGLLRREDHRAAVRQLGAALSIGLASVLLRPFTGYQVVQLVADPAGTRATVVSAALLPIRLAARHGGDLRLASGEVGQLVLPHAGGGRVAMTAALDLPFLGWVVVGALCLTPVLVALITGGRTQGPRRPPA